MWSGAWYSSDNLFGKTDVIIIDEFSMIDLTLFLPIEGLYRHYEKGNSKGK